MMDIDVKSRDQAVNNADDALSDATAKVNGLAIQDSIQLTKSKLKQSSGVKCDALKGTLSGTVNKTPKVTFRRADSIIPPKAATPAARPSRALALTYAAIALTGLLFIGAVGPVLSPRAFSQSSGWVSGLRLWSPLPQGLLLGLLAALLGLAYVLRKPSQGGSTQAVEVPPGVTVGTSGLLCDAATGAPLQRGLRLATGGQGFTVGPNHAPLPKGCVVGPGGVLLHASSGRPIPHSCRLSDATGELLSSTGEPLPDSMSVGPNSTLLAADGTLLSPDLQPVPAGFALSRCGGFLLRPNGKPVPRGVHVGPGFRLLKPNGEHLPDGVKIGPCGTIICVDGTILCSDGHPAPPGFALNAEKTLILDPQGRPLEDTYSMGPNGTLISADGTLVTALGKQHLPSSSYALGPLGNLLLGGTPLPAAAAFDATGRLVAADGAVLDVLPCDEEPCSGQEMLE